MSKHTQEEWEIHGNNIEALDCDGNFRWKICTASKCLPQDEQLGHNLRLIAAAPDMLEALKALTHEMREVLAHYSVPKTCIVAALMGGGAIAKATGQEEAK